MAQTLSRRALLGGAFAASVATLTAKVADSANAELPASPAVPAAANIPPSQVGLFEAAEPSNPFILKSDYSTEGLERFKEEMLSRNLPVIASGMTPLFIRMTDPALGGGIDTVDLGGASLTFLALSQVVNHLRTVGGVTDWRDVRVLVREEQEADFRRQLRNNGNPAVMPITTGAPITESVIGDMTVASMHGIPTTLGTKQGVLKFVVDDTLPPGNAYVIDASVVRLSHRASSIDGTPTLWLSDYADHPHRIVEITHIGNS